MRLDVLSGTGPIQLVKRFFEDGVQADAGTVTAHVYDANGVEVSTGAATKAGTGVTTEYGYVLSIAVLADPTWLRVAWARDTGGFIAPDDTVEVTVNALFTEVEARNSVTIGDIKPLANTTTYTDVTIAAARLKITDLFEHRTGRSWVTRYARVAYPGADTDYLWLGYAPTPRTSTGQQLGGAGWRYDIQRVLAVTVDGVALDPADVELVDARLYRMGGTSWATTSALTRSPIVIEYVYGMDPVPYEARAAGLSLLKDIVPSKVSGYAESMSNEDGTFRFTPRFPRDVYEFLQAHDARSRLG